MANCNDRVEPPEKDRISFTVSISGVYNWFKDRKKKRDINNIKRYENTILKEYNSNGKED